MTVVNDIHMSRIQLPSMIIAHCVCIPVALELVCALETRVIRPILTSDFSKQMKNHSDFIYLFMSA